MMRRFGMIGMACLLAACQSHRMNIEGYVGETQEKKIYLGEITNEYFHIILVGPDGKILAKGLRHEKLMTVSATFLETLLLNL